MAATATRTRTFSNAGKPPLSLPKLSYKPPPPSSVQTRADHSSNTAGNGTKLPALSFSQRQRQRHDSLGSVALPPVEEEDALPPLVSEDTFDKPARFDPGPPKALESPPGYPMWKGERYGPEPDYCPPSVKEVDKYRKYLMGNPTMMRKRVRQKTFADEENVRKRALEKMRRVLFKSRKRDHHYMEFEGPTTDINIAQDYIQHMIKQHRMKKAQYKLTKQLSKLSLKREKSYIYGRYLRR